jgi:hypothetical protein
VNEFTRLPRASHVNDGTSVPPAEVAWPQHEGPVVRARRMHVEHDARPDVTALGGLALPLALLKRLRAADEIDGRVHVFKRHFPYHESDHVIAQALMLYAGGSCLEDMAMLQGDDAVLKMLGAVRTPDPTTSGDFLRRFDDTEALAGLRGANDELQVRAWRIRSGKKKRPLGVLHLDGHTKQLYGLSKEGADFDYKARWSYSVLLASLDDGECVAARLRPGNVRSSDGAAELLITVLARLLAHFDDVLVLADSDYDRKDIREVCHAHGVWYAFVGRETINRPEIAMNCENWRPFRTRAHRQRDARGKIEKRRGKRDRRRARARARGYTDLELERQHLSETPGPDGTRLIVRRQRLAVSAGKESQRQLWEEIRYRYVVTNLPPKWSAEDVVDETYRRCDQENVIAQLGSGIAMWRMPVAEFAGNAAWLEIARLAWNLGRWVALLALPPECARWEWKRLRRAFVDIAVQVVHQARQLRIRILGAYRFAATFMRAHALLQA